MLPVTNKFGYYEIRLESIGGLGANLCGKILGELGALYLGLNSVSFASYGSEKRGSPVKSYIRYSAPDKEILINSPIETPHMLGLFHEKMAGKEPVMAGVSEESCVVINTPAGLDETRDHLKMHAGTLFCIDALKIAADCKTRVNMVMLGAIAKASGFIPLDSLKKIVEDTVGKKYPQALKGNLEGIVQGYNRAVCMKYTDKKFPYVAYRETEREWGYKTAPIGGVNPIYGSTVSNDLSASREGFVPVFHKDKCINCGLCDTACPDMVYQFAEGSFRGKASMVNLGPDYHHCKGCLRCVEVCPVNAITEARERDIDIRQIHVRNQELIIGRMQFEDTGQSSWIESESTVVNETR